jgi:hypothetical protein
MPGEFAEIVTAFGFDADVGGPDRRSQAVQLFRLAKPRKKLPLLETLIKRRLPDF